MERRIILLVGPKGAGKTYLGSRLEQEVGIPFVRVEPIWLALARAGLEGAEFDQAGQQQVLAEVERCLQSNDSVVLESTGTAPWFYQFLKSLSVLGRVHPIRVCAPMPLCLMRIRERDGNAHIPVSDDRIAEINSLADRVQLAWVAVINNRTKNDADQFLDMVRVGTLE